MSRFLRRFQDKFKSNQASESSNVEAPVFCIDTISLSLPEPSKSFKIPRDATVFLRFVHNRTAVETEESAFATKLTWNPTLQIPLADFTIEVILGPRTRLRPDRKLETFGINVAQVNLSGQGDTCENTYVSSKRDKNSSLTLKISFSCIPTSSVSRQDESSAVQPALQQATTVPESDAEATVDQPADPEDMPMMTDIAAQLAAPVESARLQAESLKGTRECLAEAKGYIDGIIDLVKNFAEVHPVSKLAVGALTKVYDLVKKQEERDESIQALASSMRDMLASLSEVKDLENIKLIQPVFSLAMTLVEECAKFIDAYVKHGFWGRTVRQSLSSRTADTIQRFRQSFGELKEKFKTAISVETIKLVTESLQGIEILKKDLRNIGDVLVAQSDDERLSKLTRSKRAAYDRGLKCLPGTRKDILKLIYDWIDNKESGNNVFWLRGAAGTGKSTIASTIAGQLDNKDDGLGQLGLGGLGATFFCKRDENTLNQPHLVFPTIAFRLASTYPLLKTAIVSALRTNPDIGDSSITNQFQELIVEPLSKVSNDLDVPPVVTIVDAVDECGTQSTRAALLQCLREARRLPAWFKLLITSRPEPDLVKDLTGLGSEHEVNTSSEQSIADIRVYTEHCLANLRSGRGLGSGWPGDFKAKQLISRAGGLFIWVTLSFRFMSQEPSPSEALDLVLKPSGQPHLDALYLTVLAQALTDLDHLSLIRDVLGCVVVSKIPLSLQSLCILLDVAEEKGRWARDRLASVLLMDSDSTIGVIHPSFLDFLTDHKRSKEFFINIDDYNVSLARGCLQVMNGQLHRNICRLTEASLNDQIHDLALRLREHVSDELAYSCRFWTEHLTHVANANHDPLLEKFWDEHVLHWLEVMSLRGETGNAVKAVRRLRKWLLPEHPMTVFIEDVLRFCANFGYVLERSAPHIYTSAAIFAPTQSCLSISSKREFSTPPKLENPPKIPWDPSLLTMNGHRGGVWSVACTRDGSRIVSGSDDNTLRVWDAESGSSILGPLVGHTDWVTSVAFSPDGTKIVSGSRDKTLRVWDAESGSSILGPLVGHTSSVTSVAFSPDGTKIVSGSHDNTLRVWDAESGSSILAPLVGHTDFVTSVAFSPDGTKIVSGSLDKTLRVWDAESWSRILGPYVHRPGWVTSVPFSLDGTKIVSCSLDQTLRVWDAESGDCLSISDSNYAPPLNPQAGTTTILVTLSDEGWVTAPSHAMPMLWIPAHLRSPHDVAAVWGSKYVWFDSQHLPMTVSALDFSWWLHASTSS